eukprot:762453-Hanusia_phi.AAC.1
MRHLAASLDMYPRASRKSVSTWISAGGMGRWQSGQSQEACFLANSRNLRRRERGGGAGGAGGDGRCKVEALKVATFDALGGYDDAIVSERVAESDLSIRT